MNTIYKISNEEILDLLMTSDFNENYKPEELKYLLMKFKYFYRLMNGKRESIETYKEGKISEICDKLTNCEEELRQTKIKLAKKEDFICQLENKSLSLSERIKGKINLNKN